MERHLSCCLIKGSLNIHSFGIRKRKVPLGSQQWSDEAERAFSIRYFKNHCLLFSSYERLPGKTTTAVVTWSEIYAQAWCIMTISKPGAGSPHYLRCLINPGFHETLYSQLYRFRTTKQGGSWALTYMMCDCFCIFHTADMFSNRYLGPTDCQAKHNTCKHIHISPACIRDKRIHFSLPLNRWIPDPINCYYYTFPKEEIQNAVSFRDFKWQWHRAMNQVKWHTECWLQTSFQKLTDMNMYFLA